MLTAGQYRDIANEVLEKKTPKVEAVLARVEEKIKTCAESGGGEIDFVFTGEETFYKVFEKVIEHLRELRFICDRLQTRGSNVWHIRW